MNVSTDRVSRGFITATNASVQAAKVLLFALLTAVSAQIVIPNNPVPFTLQTLTVLVAGGVLGKQYGAMSMGAYLFAGVIGLPVFASAGFGVARLLGPTGGYLLAFPVAAFLVGRILEAPRPSLGRTVLAMTTALLVIFSLGSLHLYAVTPLSFEEAFGSGFLIFSVWDVAKLASASAIVYGLRRR